MGKGNGVSTHSPNQQMDDNNLENYEANYEQNGSELRIAHNQEDFLNGEQYILTMKDQPVLLGDDINEDEEEMVNVDLNNIQKQKAFLKAKAKISKGGLGMNTAEWNDYGEVKRPRILDKYDIEEEEKEGMVLNLRNHSVKRKNKNFTEEKFDGGERNEMIQLIITLLKLNKWGISKIWINFFSFHIF